MLITFSGLDGAGKTTLIDTVKETLERQGYRVVVRTMYDDLSFYAVLRWLRDTIKTACGKVPQKRAAVFVPAPVATPRESPRDPKLIVTDKKNLALRLFYRIVRSRTLKRAALFMDVLCFLWYRCMEEKMRGRVLITDRYLYDSLADVADLEGRRWGFLRWFLRLVPTPDAPIFVDTPPEVAFARKPEYPLDYLQWRQGAYRAIFQWVRCPIVLVNTDLVQTKLQAESMILERIPPAICASSS